MLIPTKPIVAPSAWTGPTLQSGDGWIHILSAEEQHERAAAAQALSALDLPLTAIDTISHELPIVGPKSRCLTTPSMFSYPIA